jgi:hypothetical protein
MTRGRHPKLKLRCSIIEFFNKELEEQLENNTDAFKKNTNLKSLLNMGVCMNGVVSRIHDQRQLDCCHSIVLEV